MQDENQQLSFHYQFICNATSLLLTWSTWVGSNLDMEKAVVPESTIFKALWIIVGEARVWDGPEKATFYREQYMTG